MTYDLEIWVRGHSRSLKLVPCDSLGTVSLFAVTSNYDRYGTFRRL